MGAQKAIREADMIIVGGTSLRVYPAASYIYDFRGKHMAVINREPLDIKLNETEDVSIVGSLGEVFAEIDKALF